MKCKGPLGTVTVNEPSTFKRVLTPYSGRLARRTLVKSCFSRAGIVCPRRSGSVTEGHSTLAKE